MLRSELVEGERVGVLLTLRHASKRSSGTWGPDDYDVIHDGHDIGRIFRPSAGAPDDRPSMWTITGAIVKPSHGFADSLGEAKAKFAETWRAWVDARRMK
jgi:hypothetical protein